MIARGDATKEPQIAVADFGRFDVAVLPQPFVIGARTGRRRTIGPLHPPQRVHRSQRLAAVVEPLPEHVAFDVVARTAQPGEADLTRALALARSALAGQPGGRILVLTDGA